MDSILVQLIIVSGLALLLILSGILMRRQGKPYKTGLFTLHKLSAVGGIVSCWIIIARGLRGEYLPHQVTDYRFILLAAVVLSVISGALQSFGKPANRLIVITHKIFSYLLIITIIYFLILSFKS